MLKHTALITIFTLAAAPAFAVFKPNCSLQFSNGYVTDSVGMSDEVKSQSECLQKCKDYAKESVEVMADGVETLSWKCNYEKKTFHEKKVK